MGDYINSGFGELDTASFPMHLTCTGFSCLLPSYKEQEGSV